MAIEIERKFLVIGDAWRELAEGEEIRQGYISTVKERVIRVRTVGKKGTLTIKGITVKGSTVFSDDLQNGLSFHFGCLRS